VLISLAFYPVLPSILLYVPELR